MSSTVIFVKNEDGRIMIEYLDSINSILKASIIYYDDTVAINQDIKNVIFVRLFPGKINWSKDKVHVFYLNTEQITAYNDMENRVLQFWSNNSDKIINEPTLLDYSLDNIMCMKDYKFKKVHLPYLIREEEKSRLEGYSKQAKVCDIVIVGWLTPRRMSMVNKLVSMGFRILPINMNAWGDHRDQTIGRCKVLLNIHASDNYTIFESIRCDRWMFAGMKVLSETSTHQQTHSNMLTECDYDDIPVKLAEVLAKEITFDKDLHDREEESRRQKVQDFANSILNLKQSVLKPPCFKFKMSVIEKKYDERCRQNSDINEHLPTLYRYGKECKHITECGVRGVVSSYAFANALKGKEDNKLIQVDLETNDNVTNFGKECQEEGVNVTFYKMSDLECPLEQTELLFIDTWHIYGHLKRELERWHPYVSKYIAMHDTTVDEWFGETIRAGWDAAKQSQESGIPVSEINKGLWPAITEFLQNHPEWEIDCRYYNCNGLTILKRIN